MVCAFFTWLLILYAEFVVMRIIILPDLFKGSLYAIFHFGLFQTFTVMAVASHVRTMLSDPVLYN